MANWQHGLQLNLIAVNETERDRIYTWLKQQAESEKASGKIAGPVKMIKISREFLENNTVQEEF